MTDSQFIIGGITFNLTGVTLRDLSGASSISLNDLSGLDTALEYSGSSPIKVLECLSKKWRPATSKELVLLCAWFRARGSNFKGVDKSGDSVKANEIKDAAAHYNVKDTAAKAGPKGITLGRIAGACPLHDLLGLMSIKGHLSSMSQEVYPRGATSWWLISTGLLSVLPNDASTPEGQLTHAASVEMAKKMKQMSKMIAKVVPGSKPLLDGNVDQLVNASLKYTGFKRLTRKMCVDLKIYEEVGGQLTDTMHDTPPLDQNLLDHYSNAIVYILTAS